MTQDELDALRKSASRNLPAFWARQANNLEWQAPFKKNLEWKFPHARWFADGCINACVNCVDRHVATWRKNKAAIIWESEQGEVRTLTYRQLHSEVCRFANALLALGAKKGSVVGIYMGMVPEVVVAMLACARIGATHNVVFGGFSADALADRMNDSGAIILVTQDVAHRRGDHVPLKATVDVALKHAPSIRHVVVLKRGDGSVPMKRNRDVWWHDAVHTVRAECKAEKLRAEHPLFIIYTSGSTGKPKGILHTTGGYLTHVTYTTKLVFDLQDTDVYFCTADVGWITGHSYTVYGPLSNGATVLMYEGAPTYPDIGRFWSLIERHKATIFYTAPTAIRSFMRAGDEWPSKYNLSSLRLLGSVGEPINPEAWLWYHRVIGKLKCPVVDTWWQTETGGIMISSIPTDDGVDRQVPGSATQPIPGIKADVVRNDGRSCKPQEAGFLAIQHPWPGMLRTVYGNDERYRETYWADYPQSKQRIGWYTSGDGARKDHDGNIWIFGRVDDVINVSGHRLGTAEIESALVSHRSVAEAAIVTRPDAIKGNAVVAFVTLKLKARNANLVALRNELRSLVAKTIGHIAKPDEIRFAESLPKTRSGKIMRRLLREVAKGGTGFGDITTLEDFTVLQHLRSDDDG